MSYRDPRMFEPAQLMETYWHRLVARKHAGAPLKDSEQEYYDLSMVMGGLYGEGLVGYFDMNFADFDRHVAVLEAHGFRDVADGLRRTRTLLFGDAPLTQEVVDAGIDRYFEHSDEGTDPAIDEANDILAELQERCVDIGEHRTQFGLRQGFFERVD